MKNNLIHFRAEFIIKDRKLKEYKKLVLNMSKLVAANEPSNVKSKEDKEFQELEVESTGGGMGAGGGG